jgi:hypothetical protein
MIPGWFIAAVTFPGIILHEWAHKFFCERTGVPVYEVMYFQFGESPAGYVRHGPPTSASQHLLISLGPLFINTVACFVIAVFAGQAKSGSILNAGLLWLAVSAGMHAFPSGPDIDAAVQGARQFWVAGKRALFYLTYPFLALLHVANALRFFWFDAIYAAIWTMGGLELGKSSAMLVFQ